jgi:DNA-binding CsgD family transcriptional regulator
MSLYQYGERCADSRRAEGMIVAAGLGATVSLEAANHEYSQEHRLKGDDWAQICQRSGILLNAANGLCIQYSISTGHAGIAAVHGVFDSDILGALMDTINAHALADFQPNRFQRADDFRPLILNHLPHMIGADRDCHCLVIGLGLGGDSLVFVVLIRAGSAAAFQPEDIARAKAVRGFIRDAVVHAPPPAVDHTLEASFKFILDRLPFGIISLNEQNQIEFANRNANQLLDQGDGLMRSQRSIAAVNIRDNVALHAAMAHSCAQENSRNGAHIMLIGRSNERRPLSVTVQNKCQHGQHAGVLMYVVDPNIDTSATVSQICASYGLTQVEVELTCHLISGITLQESASALRIKPDTARGYLKRIFSKVGVNRQAELVRLVLSSFIPSSAHCTASES